MFLRVWLMGFLVMTLVACGQAPRSYLQDRNISHGVKKPSQAGVCTGHQYIVKRNDSISLIAQRCGVDMDELARVNDIYPPFVLYPGQELVLPDSKTAQSSPKKVDWAWPVKHYQEYKFVKGTGGLNGLEIFGEKGTLVHAVDDGEVVFADNSVSNFGLMVIIRHADDYLTVYAHNQAVQVKEGQAVKKNDVIANLGDSGLADQPKLYFEARLRGRKVNVDSLINPPK
jgi:hypothetical protein